MEQLEGTIKSSLSDGRGLNNFETMRPLFAALLPAALIALPYDAYPNTNAAYALDLGPKSPGPSTSTAFYKALGGAASLAACAAALRLSPSFFSFSAFGSRASIAASSWAACLSRRARR